METGSSPLTRGKPAVPNHDMAPVRLIPAHAGKTENGGKAWNKATAHPRSRGENPLAAWLEGSCEGSSPLTRGKPVLLSSFGTRKGLIPAHAGKTVTERAAILSGAAHPRSRGENVGLPQPRTPLAGSSPLTRGKRLCYVEELPDGGLIPAHAGKTPDQRREAVG